jgi:hypothetical protein
MNDMVVQLEGLLEHPHGPRTLDGLEDELGETPFSLIGYKVPSLATREIYGLPPAAAVSLPQQALAGEPPKSR